MKLLTWTIVVIILLSKIAYSQRCEEITFWSGSEPVLQYGIDTTGVPWVLYEPFTERYQLQVGANKSSVYEKLSLPVISPTGETWAAFGVLNNLTTLVINGEDYPLRYTNASEIVFSADGTALSFIGNIGEEQYIVVYAPTDPYEEPANRVYKEVRRSELLIQKIGAYFLNQNGMQWAYIGKRGDEKALVINNKETILANDIAPIGFLWDSKFAYAVNNGNSWQVYHGENQVGGVYNAVIEPSVNRMGTAMTFVGRYQQGAVAVLWAEEYAEPIVSNVYDNIFNLTLAPEGPLMAFQASRNSLPFMVYGRAEYGLEQDVQLSSPMFTVGSASMAFIACRNACFITIDGTRYRLEHLIDPRAKFAVAPNGKTIAISTALSLTVQQIGQKERYATKMMDEMKPCVYNWRTRSYEAMGKISNTIFILRCRA